MAGIEVPDEHKNSFVVASTSSALLIIRKSVSSHLEAEPNGYPTPQLSQLSQSTPVPVLRCGLSTIEEDPRWSEFDFHATVHNIICSIKKWSFMSTQKPGFPGVF
jgi:hypothetical protein